MIKRAKSVNKTAVITVLQSILTPRFVTLAYLLKYDLTHATERYETPYAAARIKVHRR